MITDFPRRGPALPTRRIFELALVTALLLHPAVALVRLWATKTLRTADESSALHGVAEIVTVSTR